MTTVPLMKSILCAALAFTAVTSFCAHGADDPLSASIDLAGLVIQHGANIKAGSGDDLIQPSTSYDYIISGKVTGSGAFSFIEPGTDLGAAFDRLDPGFSENLAGTVINASGKLPFTVVSKKFKGSFDAGPFPASGKATVKAGIDGDGEASFSVTGTSFTLSGFPVNGRITFDEGTCNVLFPATAGLPQRPDLLFSIPKQEAVGNNVYSNQTITLTVSKGHTARFYILLQNDGTQLDSFTVHGPAGNDEIALSYFSGKTNVTDEVVAGTFSASNVASRTGAVLKLKVKVKKSGAQLEGPLILRSAAPVLNDTIQLIVNGA